MDPRLTLLAGVLVLVCLGLGVRTIAGPSPIIGRRINQALDEQAHGNAAAAARDLEVVIQVRPEDSEAWLRAGRALVPAGQPREAAEHLARATELNPASLTARYEWGKALMAGWLDNEAEAVLAGLLARKADHADGLYQFAALAAGRGDVDAAVDRLKRALAAGPSYPDGYRREPRFDSVRGDAPRLVRDQRYPGAFREASR